MAEVTITFSNKSRIDDRNHHKSWMSLFVCYFIYIFADADMMGDGFDLDP